MKDHSNVKGSPVVGLRPHAAVKSASRTMGHWWSQVLAPALVGLLAFALYTNTFSSNFVYDDDFALVRSGQGVVLWDMLGVNAATQS